MRQVVPYTLFYLAVAFSDSLQQQTGCLPSTIQFPSQRLHSCPSVLLFGGQVGVADCLVCLLGRRPIPSKRRHDGGGGCASRRAGAVALMSLSCTLLFSLFVPALLAASVSAPGSVTIVAAPLGVATPAVAIPILVLLFSATPTVIAISCIFFPSLRSTSTPARTSARSPSLPVPVLIALAATLARRLVLRIEALLTLQRAAGLGRLLLMMFEVLCRSGPHRLFSVFLLFAVVRIIPVPIPVLVLLPSFILFLAFATALSLAPIAGLGLAFIVAITHTLDTGSSDCRSGGNVRDLASLLFVRLGLLRHRLRRCLLHLPLLGLPPTPLLLLLVILVLGMLLRQLLQKGLELGLRLLQLRLALLLPVLVPGRFPFLGLGNFGLEPRQFPLRGPHLFGLGLDSLLELQNALLILSNLTL
mmetsp:Transcript_72509/g.151353  ORF Transcript_72509/g.151353 Transcript_72509/m.151353 type:complete len:416 (+) Transcript_72509:599-1846(+)